MMRNNRTGDEIRRQCWTWIGHKLILCGERSSGGMVALGWRPAVGRPRKKDLAQVVQRLDNVIHWINHYPVDKC